MPALPLHEAVHYVVAAYVIVVVLLVAYAGLMTRRMGRVERDIAELSGHGEPPA
jgi:hypothetical protein